jgi:transcriptional antiterminator RfaH
MSCGSRSTAPRWHCVWTHPQREYQALQGLVEQHWDCYLPLCIERGNKRPDRIAALFPRYLFVRMDPVRDPWGCIQHTAGVGGLIRHAPDRPTPIPHGVVEHLLARTSSRSVVDDPGDAPPRHIPLGASVSLVGGAFDGLAGVVALSGPDRCRVLLSLFAGVVPLNVPTANLVVVAG